MGIFDYGKNLADPIRAVGDLYTTDKARIEAQTNYEAIAQKPILAQTGVNETLARSLHLFNSGWQPMIGWTCGFLILAYYAPQIAITTYVWGEVCIKTGIAAPFPMKPDDLLNLVYLLFGFGTHSILKAKL